MKMFRLSCASALVLSFALTGGALALDPDAAAKAFLTPAKTAQNQMSVSFGSAVADGADIVVRDVKTTAKIADTEQSVYTVSEVRLVDVSETGNGQYKADKAVYKNLVLGTSGAFTATAPEMTINDLRTRDASGDKVPMPIVYRSATGANMVIDLNSPDMKITIDRFDINLDDFAGDLPVGGTVDLTKITVPVNAFPAGPTSPQALGYEGNLVFNITAKGRARFETSGFALEDLTISGDDVGSLSFAIDVDNYPDLLNSAQPNPMEVMNIVLKSISLKYTDDSFAERVLDTLARARGLDRVQYAQQMSMALPFLLSAIGNQEFQNQVATAAGTFLNDPGTIEINVKPTDPMSAAQIMGVAQSAPHTLPDKLNVTVEAR